jgi:hypothetical protein
MRRTPPGFFMANNPIYRPEDFFFFGTFAPERRASFKAIATACLRLVTLLPLPDFRAPRLCSFITL